MLRSAAAATRLVASVATMPFSNTTRASATSFHRVATDTPLAATETTGDAASVSTRSMSWIIRSRTTSTSTARPDHGVRRTHSISRGATTRSLSARNAGAKRSMCPTWRRVPFRAARATRSAAAGTSAAIGFSTKRWMPASISSAATAGCAEVGTVIDAASTLPISAR